MLLKSMGGQATVSNMYRFGPQGPPLVGVEIFQLTIGRGCSVMLTYYSSWLDKLSKIVKYITKQTFGAYFAFQLSNQHQSKYLHSTPPDNYKSIKLMPWSPQIQSGSLVLLQSDHMVTRQGWAPTMDQSECWKCDPMTDAPLPPWTRYDTYDDRSWFIGHTPNMVDIRLGTFIMSTYCTMTTTNSTKST